MYFRPILIVLIVLLVVEGVVALWVVAERNGWELPVLEDSAYAQQPPRPTPAPTPTPQPTPAPDDRPLMSAGGPSFGPVPLMPNGKCPSEFPIAQGSACYPKP